MDDWLSIPAEDFCDSVRDGTHDSPKPAKNGEYLITSRHIIGGRVELENAYRISPREFESINKRSKVDKWDVLFSMIGTVGEVCFVGQEPNFAIKNIGLFKSKNEISGRWLYYYLQSPTARTEVEALKRGTTQSYVPLGSLRRLPVRVPQEEAIQRRIINILQALDDKIDLNRRTNETLEAMARAVFKSWFVDFDPVHAKAAGKAPAHMDAETATLFPDAFGEDGLPVGWQPGVLSQIAENPRRGVSPEDCDESTPYIGLEHMPRKSISLTEWALAGKVTSTKSRFVAGEFLFGKLRPYFHKVGIAPTSGICSTDILVVKPKKGIWGGFVLACISSDEFVAYTDQTSSGTKMPRTNWRDMGRFDLVLPSEKVAEAFNSLSEPMLAKIVSNIHENQTLTALRDLLLPKLMSGELRLRDAEKIIEGAA